MGLRNCDNLYSYGKQYNCGSSFPSYFSNNCLGNLGSLFNFCGDYGYGYGSYGYGCGNSYEKSMGATIGIGLGNRFLGFLQQLIPTLVANKQDNSLKTMQADVADLEADKAKFLRDLGMTEDDVNKWTLSDKDPVNEALKSAEKQYNNNEATISAYLEANNEDKPKLESSFNTAMKNRATFENALKKAQEAKEAKEKEIAKAKADLAQLNKEIAEAKADYNEKMLDRADGTRLGRASEKNYNDLFPDNSDKVNEGAKDYEIKAGLKYLITAFKTEKDAKNKDTFKTRFINLYNALDHNKRSKDLMAAYDIISAWQKPTT